MEKELAATTPLLASKLGTDLLAIPSPSRPFGAALPRNEPVWICPQPNVIGTVTILGCADSVIMYMTSSTNIPEDDVLSDKYLML
jgi:hypothetical protein